MRRLVVGCAVLMASIGGVVLVGPARADLGTTCVPPRPYGTLVHQLRERCETPSALLDVPDASFAIEALRDPANCPGDGGNFCLFYDGTAVGGDGVAPTTWTFHMTEKNSLIHGCYMASTLAWTLHETSSGDELTGGGESWGPSLVLQVTGGTGRFAGATGDAREQDLMVSEPFFDSSYCAYSGGRRVWAGQLRLFYTVPGS